MTTLVNPTSRALALPGGAVPPGDWALAAVVTALHRLTTQETVHVDSLRGVLPLDLSDDPSAADLVARIATARPDDGATPDLTYRVDGGWDDEAATPVLRATADGVHLTGAEGPLGTLAGRALAEITARPGRPLSTVDLADADAVSWVTAFGGHGGARPEGRPVHALVAEQARLSPDAVAVAVAAGETTLTYRELEAAADAEAARLAGAGVRPGDVVAVLGVRSAALIAGLLGVLKAGGAYLALDVEAPAARVAALLADAGVTVALADETLRDRLPGTVRAFVLGEDVDAAPEGWRPVEVTAGDLAYVSYTSGSTGTPKGVAVPHRAVARLVGPGEWAEFRATDVFLQLAPVAFDASTLEIWAPLTNGGRLAVFPAGPVTTDKLATFLTEQGVTVAWFTAGLFHQLVAARTSAFAGLRHVLAGGDVIKADAVRKLLKAHPGLTFTNGYGPTENTTFTACWTSTDGPAGGSVPIGRPITGTRVLVLDADLQLVPIGVPGQLYAGGAGLAQGYLNRPGATAAAFVPSPLPTRPGERIYATGDLVRWLPDGTLDFLGRADHQVKVNGYRVEPGEVEAAIVADGRVRDAVVVTQPDSAGGKRLLAYVTPADPADELEGLRDGLRDRLPAYLVPFAVIAVEELPLNRNGKVDRAALPSADRLPRDVGGEYVAPATSTQRYLTRLWGEVLGIEPIGVEDDFFELGGHSLMAGELITRLQDELSVELSAQTLYLRPTIAELAETVEQA
ncbi:amino acid adenylation domain-containing protein [Amycolatopsis sp. lyj-23]|uniref:amino acid adenylation domain-containing protein n=1 Tax=Amycolatopsis sp. lyj-23 TaxID=2789283 RepID=UPI00397E62AD